MPQTDTILILVFSPASKHQIVYVNSHDIDDSLNNKRGI